MKIPQDQPFIVEKLDGTCVSLDAIDTALQLASALTGASGGEDAVRREAAFWKEKLNIPGLSSTQATYVAHRFNEFMADIKKNLVETPLPKSPEPSDSSPTIPLTA